MRRAAALSRAESIGDEDFACSNNSCLSSTLWRDFELTARPRQGAANDVVPAEFDSGGSGSDREKLVNAMEKAGWVQAKAARLLNLTPRQIAYALVKHQIPVKKF